jgi:hypothetical protein
MRRGPCAGEGRIRTPGAPPYRAVKNKAEADRDDGEEVEGADAGMTAPIVRVIGANRVARSNPAWRH